MKLMICLIIVLSLTASSANNPLVSTNNGDVIGNQKLYLGDIYNEFLGIPFAKPPVDELRWEKPVPAMPWWPHVLNATVYQQHCTQMVAQFYPFIGMPAANGEDCLYLNIFVPYGVHGNRGNKLPVMVWVYGGGYILGTAEMYPGYALALYGNTIVVTFNYRVGTLGWISTGDSELAGNYGLWDVQAALIWINNNIEKFGGDVNQITLFGQSAGAAMTSHAVISPQTNNLFQRAIILSGSSTGYFGLAEMPLRLSMLLAEVLNCSPLSSTADLSKCLRRFGAQTLDFWGVVVQLRFEDRLPTLLPVIDGEFIQRSPRDSFIMQEGSHIGLMTGSCEDDAAGFVLLNPIAFPPAADNNVAKTNESLWSYCQLCLGFATNNISLINTMMDRYPAMRSSIVHERTIATSHATTDWWFGSSSHWEARTHSRAMKAPTYHYRFKYRQSFLDAYQAWVNGSHMDDVYSVFGKPFMERYRRFILRKDFNSADKILSEIIMSYYSNFAHTGNPNIGPNLVNHFWSEYNPSLGNYIQFSEKIETHRIDDFTLSDYHFWDEFPRLYDFPEQPQFHNQKKISEKDIEQMLVNYKRFLLNTFKGNHTEMIEAVMEKFNTDRINGFINNY